VFKWVLRLTAGGTSIVLAILGNAILVEIPESIEPPIWAVLLAIGFHVCGGFIAYGTFFRWSLSRIGIRGGEVVRQRERTIGAILVGVGLVLALVALVAVVGLVGVSAAPSTVLIIAFLIAVSIVAVATGMGLRRGASWSRRAALFSGFVFFGGVPIGTALALSLWWLAAQRPNMALEPTARI
jgi:hypothetical protein